MYAAEVAFDGTKVETLSDPTLAPLNILSVLKVFMKRYLDGHLKIGANMLECPTLEL
jgi:hypothetical protein